jgi:S-DNA-T family DNA segregation ATPase FtsK/SpoIIIE
MTDYYPTNGTAPDSPAALFDNRIGLAEPDHEHGQGDAYDAERVDVFEGTVLAVVDDVDRATPFTESDQDDDTEAAEAAESTESGEPDDLPSTLTWAAPDRATGERAPIIPPWLRSAEARKAAVRQAVSAAGYHTAFHAVRTPVYATKTLGYSLVGCGRVTGKVTRWVRAEEGNYELRQKAAETNDAYTWQALNKIRERESRGRMWGLAIATAATLIVVAILALTGLLAPVLWAGLAALIVVTARAGRPADKTILGRVATGRRFTKLTGDLVRNSLVSLAVRGITTPEQIEFCHPGIHRDGPGWLARVNLPEGVTAVKVLERRDGLASALRIPVDQVWPAAGPDHPGQLDLWVGYKPASEMGQPTWSLAAENARTSFFEPAEFSSDERCRPIETTMFQRSYLIGGQPGSGKSYAARALIAIAMLDPNCELKIAEYKGTGDFLDLEPLCSTYVVGVDDEALNQGVAIGRWLVEEAEKRGKRILAARKRGEAPQGKVTPELAAKPGSGLHPVCVVIDEAHELFLYSPDAASDFERAIKRLRALGICVILATQIPDKASLPPGITRCVTNRWCLSVAGQVENDMILGTGAYKRGLTGTVYRPVFDAGWGCMTGGATPVAARSQFPADDVWDAMVARATSLRGGVAVGAPIETAPARDLLADLTEVAASNGQHWSSAAEALTETWPEAYTHLSADALSDMARTAGLASVDVKISGTVRKGYRRADLNKLRAEHDEAQTKPQEGDE